MNTNYYTILIVAFAALIQSGFSLGTSMMALLSGHSISRRRSHARLLALTGGFVIGSLLMVILLLSTFTYFGLLVNAWAYPIVMLVLSTLVALTGLWVLFFYYRRGDGVALWVPRGFARYLTERTAHTKNPFESFVLGAAGVLFELPATLWLMLMTGVILGSQGPRFQAAGLLFYGVLSVLCLFIVFVLVGGGHTAAGLTRFRARNKRYFQILIGLSMIILGAGIFWDHYAAFLMARGILW